MQGIAIGILVYQAVVLRLKLHYSLQHAESNEATKWEDQWERREIVGCLHVEYVWETEAEKSHHVESNMKAFTTKVFGVLFNVNLQLFI